MDPIQRKTNVTPTGAPAVGPARAADAASAAKAVFSLAAQGAEAAGKAGAPATAALETMRSRIRDAAERHGGDKAQVLRDVVGEYTKDLFGADTPDELADRITEAFTSDPYLGSIYNRLYNDATRGG